MRRFGRRLKSFTAMLLSACLVFPLGAVNAWAEEPGAAEAASEIEAVTEIGPGAAVEEAFYEEAEIASASDATLASGEETAATGKEEVTEASAATSSDAQFDEDGALLDGEVNDDVTGKGIGNETGKETDETIGGMAEEILDGLIEAPEMKTEKITPELAADTWYKDFDYTPNYSAGTITLKKYEGFSSKVTVYKTGVYSGKTCSIRIAGTSEGGGLFHSNEYVEEVIFENVVFPADCSGMFAYCPELRRVDMFSADCSEVTTMENMFYDDANLTDVAFGTQSTSKLLNTSCMFFGCYGMETINFSRLNTSKVTNMSGMFQNCGNLSMLYLPTQFSHSARNMSNMFNRCSMLTNFDFSKFSFANATDIAGMFMFCEGLKKVDMRGVNTSSLKNMNRLFAGCVGLRELDMFGVNLASVTSADEMLDGCDSLNSIYIPMNLSRSVELPRTMYTAGGTVYHYLPEHETYSFHITDIQPHVSVTGIKINTDTRTIAPGKTFQLAVWVQPANATNKEVTWYSTDTSVATVDKNGLVRALNPGTTVINVQTAEGGYSTYCLITVGTPVTGVKINTTARTMEKGSTFKLAAWPQPANASNKFVIWSSSDPAVASVDENGLVTALKSGTSKITVKTQDHGYTASCTITVHSAVTGVKINVVSGQKTILAGKNFQMAAWPQPSDANDKAVTWTSSNTAVATVTGTGLVKAIKNGTANITVKTHDGGFTKTCKITVGIPVTSVNINTTSRTITAGKTFQMAAWPQPTNASNKTVTWSSSNPAVAKVSSTGLVTGVNGGTAKITVKTNDGGLTAVCTFTVTVPVKGVKINANERTVEAGKTFQLAAWPQPSNATNKAVVWFSNNSAIATVSSTGLVTGIKNGYAVITVRTVDGEFMETCAITVGVPVTSVKINTTARTINKGATFQMAAWPQPTDASNKKVTWTSSNPAVATVSNTGLVKGIKAGTAVITVKTNDGGKTAKCTITVK